MVECEDGQRGEMVGVAPSLVVKGLSIVVLSVHIVLLLSPVMICWSEGASAGRRPFHLHNTTVVALPGKSNAMFVGPKICVHVPASNVMSEEGTLSVLSPSSPLTLGLHQLTVVVTMAFLRLLTHAIHAGTIVFGVRLADEREGPTIITLFIPYICACSWLSSLIVFLFVHIGWPSLWQNTEMGEPSMPNQWLAHLYLLGVAEPALLFVETTLTCFYARRGRKTGRAGQVKTE